MEKLSSRRLIRVALGIPAALLILLGILSIPWRPERPAEPPRVTAVARGQGPLRAGAAEVPFDPPPGAPIAGYARLVYDSVGVRDPVGARAVVLSAPGCRIALASAELLLVPDALADEVRRRVADLHLDGVVVAATHSHASVGGYWDHRVAERAATGPYDAALFTHLAERIALAIRSAAEGEVPARVSFAAARRPQFAVNRAGFPEVDGHLEVVRVEGSEGAPIAELVLYPAHPTILRGVNRLLSGDWPGRLMTSSDRRGVRLLFQGAMGDQATQLPWAGFKGVDEYGAAMAHEVAKLGGTAPASAPVLAYAEARTVLPELSVAVIPALLRPAVRTLAGGMMSPEARVSAVGIGPLTLLVVPAEPTAGVGARWRAQAGAGSEVLSVADGYVGYVETPERMAIGRGETEHTYYGPELAARLGAALAAAAQAVRAPATALPVVPARGAGAGAGAIPVRAAP